MTKTNIILIAICLTIILGTVTGYFVLSLKKQKANDNSNPTTDLTQTSQENETGRLNTSTLSADTRYADSAGFSFGYPTQAEVNDISGKEDVYSKLSIKYNDDTTELKVIDTKFTDVDKFVSSGGMIETSAKLIGATKLGDLSAKQYASNSNFYTIAIDKGILYLISGDKKTEDMQNLISSTFLFADQKQKTTNSGGDDAVYEPEETVE